MKNNSNTGTEAKGKLTSAPVLVFLYNGSCRTIIRHCIFYKYCVSIRFLEVLSVVLDKTVLSDFLFPLIYMQAALLYLDFFLET
mgnify:CR=1 FL=1